MRPHNGQQVDAAKGPTDIMYIISRSPSVTRQSVAPTCPRFANSWRRREHPQHHAALPWALTFLTILSVCWPSVSPLSCLSLHEHTHAHTTQAIPCGSLKGRYQRWFPWIRKASPCRLQEVPSCAASCIHTRGARGRRGQHRERRRGLSE